MQFLAQKTRTVVPGRTNSAHPGSASRRSARLSAAPAICTLAAGICAVTTGSAATIEHARIEFMTVQVQMALFDQDAFNARLPRARQTLFRLLRNGARLALRFEAKRIGLWVVGHRFAGVGAPQQKSPILVWSVVAHFSRTSSGMDAADPLLHAESPSPFPDCVGMRRNAPSVLRRRCPRNHLAPDPTYCYSPVCSLPPGHCRLQCTT